MEFTETAMKKRLNWERAAVASKPKTNIKDEAEFMAKDVASRWLEHAERWEIRKAGIKARRKRGLNKISTQYSNPRPPWE